MKIISFLRSAFFAALLCVPTTAFAAETISNFDVRATLDANRHLSVQESITYDFGDAERHGITRVIPVNYQRNGGTYKLRLTVEDVKRDGAEEPYDVSTSGGFLTVKIGNPDQTITGSHAYQIRYSTDRAINFFNDGHGELYWNVTGNGWDVPVEQSSFWLFPPSGVTLGSVSSTCYTGEVGSTEKSCLVTSSAEDLVAKSTRVLLPNEGLTAAFAFPAGVIAAPSLLERLWQFLADNGVLFFPLAALLIMHWRWWTKGRDPKRMTVIPEYDAPRNLSAALVGSAITNGDVPPKTVTATIIDLARRGFLKIRFGEEKHLFGKTQTYTFVKSTATPDALRPTPYESALLDGLFSGGDEQTLDDLKTNKFYQDVQTFKKGVNAEIDAQKIFASNPNTVRGAYVGVAFVIGWILVIFVGSTPLGTGAAIVTGCVIAAYGWFMPRRTQDGVKLLAEIEGFKWFLSVTEKDRLAFTDAPERTPEQFQKFLPVAIALGVEEQWAKQFASLTLPPPGWAEGNLSGYSALWLVSNIDTMHESAKSVAYAAPSQAGAGGSGFMGGGSGGGFGGGGGGSW